jgi:hypothetical protein
MHFGQGGKVWEPFPMSVDSGGGPILRTPLVALPANSTTMVYRTPHAVVYDAEPGGAAVPSLWTKKFLDDGRLVDQNALGAFGAATRGQVYGALAGTVLVGALTGALIARRRKARGGAIGAASGLALGLLAVVYGLKVGA